MINTQFTVIIPVFNEINSIEQLLIKVLNNKIYNQIIVVDDYSSDGTRELFINKFIDKVDKIIFHQKNLGKGAAIKSAQKYITGKYTIIQDADLEYDPSDYFSLISEAEKNEFQAVYGSRVLNKNMHTNIKNFSHQIRIWGNIFLTFLSNKINNQKLTDAHTCYKAFRTDIFKKIKLERDGFDFCPEITSKISNIGIKIYEVPISYHARTYEDGKKIKLKDAFLALYTLIKNK